MPARPGILIARLLWIFPSLLLLLTLYQLLVAYDVRQTVTHGTTATAQLTEFESTDRVEVSYDYISLRVSLPDGRTIEHERMSIPHSFVPAVEGKQEVDVYVLPGARQEIVLRDLGRAHWRMAAINAAMSFIGFLLLVAAVGAWNRYLVRQGDPGLRQVAVGEDVPVTS